MLRLQARDYTGASALVSSIATDSDFTGEEKQVFKLVGSLQDGHPDFHAVRVRVMLALAESRALMPWDIRREQALYVLKLSHVGARCRLSLHEELRALELCERQEAKYKLMKQLQEARKKGDQEQITKLMVDGDNELEDRRVLTDFLLDARTQFRAQMLVCDDDELTSLWLRLKKQRGRWQMPDKYEFLLWNRRKLLDAVSGAQTLDGVAADVKTPKPPNDPCWITRSDNGAACGEYAIKPGRQKLNEVSQSLPVPEALGMASSAFTEGEVMNGEKVGLGFLFVYELFTETRKLRFMSREPKMVRRSQHTFSSLLLNFFGDATASGLRESILIILSRNPWICAVLMQGLKAALT
jgi:hypothetical protein